MIKCPHCGSSSYSVVEVEPAQSRFKLLAIACSHCEAPAGFMDYYNIGARLDELEEKIDRLR
jgi:transcription elongation factor Elf1